MLSEIIVPLTYIQKDEESYKMPASVGINYSLHGENFKKVSTNGSNWGN